MLRILQEQIKDKNLQIMRGLAATFTVTAIKKKSEDKYLQTSLLHSNSRIKTSQLGIDKEARKRNQRKKPPSGNGSDYFILKN